MRQPPPLSTSDPIEIIAPSGPFDGELLDAGLALLEPLRFRKATGLSRSRFGYFSGSDEARLEELQSALDNDEIGAILIARGGYGLARLLPSLDFSGFLRRPKWIVGFSDATALHAALAGLGWSSLHAPNGTTLSKVAHSDVLQLTRALRGQLACRLGDLEVLCEGTAQGPLFGGNLTVLFAEAAAGRLVVPSGAILLLEDVTETSYRVDRMLGALRDGGYLCRAAGVALGEFTKCDPGKFQVPVSEVLRRELGSLGVPVLAGLPVGHGERNFPLLLGGRALLDSTDRSLTIEGENAAPLIRR